MFLFLMYTIFNLLVNRTILLPAVTADRGTHRIIINKTTLYNVVYTAGTLRVIGGLDVEVNPVYYFQVEARDRENTDLYDTCMVVISVENINDNSPVFTEVCRY